MPVDVGRVVTGLLVVEGDAPDVELVAPVGEVADVAGAGPPEPWQALSARASVAAAVRSRSRAVRPVMVPPPPSHAMTPPLERRCARRDTRDTLT
ncbi:hypothetical protein GCM10009858_16440 [Terrabacter carboxydivorans]|uniref:Uncharacterized protein n=1 Tax=Terrabacter carboxydivorans TaxID=619730 RepID=A0ABP5YDW4_9MICO